MRQRHLLVAAFVALGALTAAACQPVAPPPPPVGPTCSAAPGSTIPGQWVATVDPDGPAPTEVVTFEASTEAAKDAEVADLESDATVLTVEPDRVVVATDVVEPGNDEDYPKQIDGLTEAGFPGAWTAGYGGSGTTIAILDSGVQASHVDLLRHPEDSGLQGRVLQGADLVTGSKASPQGTTNFARTDPYGHGTHVAGIAAAIDNTTGGIGGAPLARILPVRVLNSCGAGSFGDVANGIEWAADQGAHVISMSLGGGGGCSTALASSIQHARALGALVVAAAGNSNSSAVGVPAGCDGVLAVGATAGKGATASRASFSNYGDLVDISAPGSDIYSTYNSGNPPYATLSGTSMSTPFVSAAAALVVQRCLAQLPGPSQARGDRVAAMLIASEGPFVKSNSPQVLRLRAAGGTYSLTYPSTPPQTTAPIAFDATADEVRAALAALPAIGSGSGNVTVAGGVITPGVAGTRSIQLLAATPDNNPLTVDASGLTAGVTVSSITTSGSQSQQTVSVVAAEGTFTLTFDGATTVDPVAFNASAVSVQTALRNLATVGPNGVAVTGAAGGPYTITFTGDLASNQTKPVSADGSGLRGAATRSPFPARLNTAAAVAASCV